MSTVRSSSAIIPRKSATMYDSLTNTSLVYYSHSCASMCGRKLDRCFKGVNASLSNKPDTLTIKSFKQDKGKKTCHTCLNALTLNMCEAIFLCQFHDYLRSKIKIRNKLLDAHIHTHTL